MIEDKFKILDDKTIGEDDNITTEARCTSCDHVFPICFNILTPKNIVHDLGRSATVTCPSCKESATTLYKDAKISVLLKLIDKINDKLADYRREFKFKYDPTTSTSPFPVVICSDCDHVFKINAPSNLNAQVIRGEFDEQLLITCPGCHLQETLSFNRTMDSFHLLFTLNTLKSELDELTKGTKDGKEITTDCSDSSSF